MEEASVVTTPAVRLFVAGDKTQVGKTTVCLGLLGHLRRSGVAASALAYIKPATQCEAQDLLSTYCRKEGIAYVGGSEAPIVYYSGFTRAVISGEQEVPSVVATVDKLCEGKRYCVIDGVGFPGVGTCVGASNGDLARALRAPVVLVARSGVGGAIDAHAQNATFFQSFGVPVLGAVFNKAPVDGFYAADKVRPVIDEFFLHHRPRETVYGVVPTFAAREKTEEDDPTDDPEADDGATHDDVDDALAKANIDHLAAHVDFAALITDASLDVFNRKRKSPAAVVLRREDLKAPSIGRDVIEQQARADGATTSQ